MTQRVSYCLLGCLCLATGGWFVLFVYAFASMVDPALAGWHYWSLVIENMVGGPQIIPLGVGLAVAALCVPCFRRAFSKTLVSARFSIWSVVVIVGLAVAVFAFM